MNAQILRMRVIKKFVNHKYPESIPPWGENSIIGGKLRAYGNLAKVYSDKHGREKQPLCRESKLDTEQIRNAFVNIFLPEQAGDQQERDRFIKFWDQALFTALTRTKFYDDNGNELEKDQVEVGLPFEYDNWILERLAIIVAQMRPEEHAERYWQPILGLGSSGEHWINIFLTHWFMDAKKIAKHELFINHWKQMLEYCVKADSWSVTLRHRSYLLPKLWICLLGIPDLLGSLWTDGDQDILVSTESYFVQIAPKIYPDRYEAVHFISWLSEPSSAQIRVQMLKPLYLVAKQAGEYWWEERRLTTAIGRYLNMLWEMHRLEIKSNAEMRGIFDGLLHETAARHEPLALELQTRMSSR